jgi:hypothetical protein
MAKKEKTREELIAEANQKTTPDAGTPEVEEDEPLSPEAQAAADKIFAGDDESDEPKVDPKHEAAEAAFKKLQRIHAAYSPTAPNEHICFGNGGEKFSLGDLRALMAVLPA